MKETTFLTAQEGDSTLTITLYQSAINMPDVFIFKATCIENDELVVICEELRDTLFEAFDDLNEFLKAEFGGSDYAPENLKG